jgi:hypothetical protein
MALSTAAFTSSFKPAPKNSLGMPTFKPLSDAMPCEYLSTAMSTDVESAGSLPAMISSSMALSRAVSVMGPICSSEFAYATRPYRDTRP